MEEEAKVMSKANIILYEYFDKFKLAYLLETDDRHLWMWFLLYGNFVMSTLSS